MKNNKKSPQTLARQAAFRLEMGGQYPVAMSAEFVALCAELVGIDTPEIIQNRIAHEGLPGYREGVRNLDGTYCRCDNADEAGAASAYVFHAPGAGADCDCDETTAALIATTTHSSGSEAVAEILDVTELL